LEAEDYVGAYDATEHVSRSGWTPDLIRQVIKAYGDADPNQRVTVHGKPTDITQRKEVYHYDSPRARGIGYVWYDLNINGLASDLTATFDLKPAPDHLVLALNDIHVM
jgi:hypothetical protein